MSFNKQNMCRELLYLYALEKVKIILDALEKPNALVPLDISKEQLKVAAKKIKTEFPHLNVLPISGDFTKPIKLPSNSQKHY